jgi:DNA modification methylase
MTFRIITGDCIEQMAEMPECSVDAIVTDPPYGLRFMGKAWDKFDSDEATRARERAGNHQTPGDPKAAHPTTPRSQGAREAGTYDLRLSGQQGFQREAYSWGMAMLRVLKPGAHLLIFGGTRTYHRLTCALEDAGFEIRDCLAWLYGSGFPKSLDVSKAIDKARDDKPEARDVARFLRDAIAGKFTADQIDARFGWSHTANNYIRLDLGRTPPWDRWLELKELLEFGDDMDAEVWRLNGRKGKPGENWDRREITGPQSGSYGYQDGERWAKEHHPTAPATPDAERWQGWGTALKPAFEPIVLARKPLSERNVASNVQRWGTGALNIDGCRIESTEDDRAASDASMSGNAAWRRAHQNGAATIDVGDGPMVMNPSGRWPANVILDETAAAMLDEQTGELHTGGGVKANIRPMERGSQVPATTVATDFAPNSGGASRFFYVSKVDREERNRGTDRNIHPTVKPVALMQWLCRMVTPPHGTVLDPFLGSGSTGMAALREGFDFIGIEREPEYVEIARARIIGDGPLFNVEEMA